MAKEINKNKALAALLESDTLTEAAEKAGISRRTLYDYMRNDRQFALAFKAAQERIQFEQVERIAADRQRAQEAIFAIMDDETQPGAVRLRAAQAIIAATDAAADRASKITNRNVTANTEQNPFGFIGRRD